MAAEYVKEGYLHLRKKKGGTWKMFYVGLNGSSLHYYKDVNSDHGGTYELAGATISHDTEEKKKDKRGQPLFIKTSNEEILIAGVDDGDSTAWMKQLQESFSKPAAPAIELEKKKKGGGKAMGMKKAVLNSGAGQSMVKKILPEEVTGLLNSLANLIAKKEGKEKAEDLKSTITKIMTKAYLQIESKTLEMKDFMSAYKPLRESFELLVKLNDNYTLFKPETLEKNFEKIKSLLLLVEKHMTKIMQPYLKPKNQIKLKQTLEYFASDSFLKGIWGDDKLRDEEDMFELSLAMQKFNSFHFYQESDAKA